MIGIGFSVREGKMVTFWYDRWCKRQTLAMTFPLPFSMTIDKET